MPVPIRWHGVTGKSLVIAMMPGMRASSLGAGPVNIQDPILVINVPADAPAPDGARPSADTVLTEKLGSFSGYRCSQITIVN